MSVRLAVVLALAATLAACGKGGASDAELLKPKDATAKTQRPNGSSDRAQTEAQL